MLELKNVSFEVTEENNRKEIIRDVSAVIGDSKFIVITGPNGGGKSTLAKLIAGIEKPTSGKIFFDGTDITDLDIAKRARLGISFAFQQPVRFKGIQVLDLLRMAAGRRIAISDACEYLSEVGLCANEYISREVNSSLSGGELKRIEIATVLARGTKLSIFDEPEAGIDLWSFQNLIQVCRHHIFDRTVTGTNDITLCNYVPDCDMMSQQKRFLFFYGIRHFFALADPCKQLPEPVLWMSIIKVLFTGFHRWQGSQNEYPGCTVKYRIKFMSHMCILFFLHVSFFLFHYHRFFIQPASAKLFTSVPESPESISTPAI